MTPTSILRGLIGLTSAMAMTLVAPSPAQAANVSLSASKSVSAATSSVTFSGGSANSAGKTVALQRRVGSGPWQTIAKTTSTSASTYAFVTKVALGTLYYRAAVGGAISNSLAVTGVYGRSVQVPNSGATFTLSGKLPMTGARPLHVQFKSGSKWFTRKVGATASNGLAEIPIHLICAAKVRMYAPKTSTRPAFVAGALLINVAASDAVIHKILCDTNAFRLANGRKELRLLSGLNTVAGDWATTMHNDSIPGNCEASFKHNPNFSSQYPAGWKAAAENIAAGQTYTTVVNGNIAGVQSPADDVGWIDSPPHRTNILGDYTHIGIGYHFGTKCYDRYYVQNFAKY
jgi:uncharacterized protein YkwD